MTDGEGRIIELAWYASIHETEGFNNLGTEYANAMAQSAIDSCLRAGLPPEFTPMFDQHLRDLNLLIFDQDETIDPKPAMLAVLKIPNGSQEPTFKRVMLISKQEIERRAQLIQEAFSGLELDTIEELQARNVGIDWLFYEMSMAALGSSCYMQQNFPNYIADWDGTSKYENAHRTISSNYLALHPEEDMTAIEDTKRLIRGFGVMMLHNTLLAKGLVKNATQANWVIEQIRKHEPEAYRGEEVADRLKAIKPSKDLDRDVAAFALLVCDPTIVLDDEPYLP